MGRHAKYTDEMIFEMIRLRHAGPTAAEVGEKFGITSRAVSGVLRYHRPGAVQDIWGSRLDRMAQRWNDGFSVKKIAEEFRLQPYTVYCIAARNRDKFVRRHQNDRNGYENCLECAAPHRAGKEQ